jgi:hypothetical protein
VRWVGSFFPDSTTEPKNNRKSMKNKTFRLLPGTIAAGFTLALSAIDLNAAITLDSILATDGASSITTTISINGSGIATASPDYSSTGTVALALGSSFGLTVDAVAAVNTGVGVNFGAKATDGTIDRASAGDFGTQGTAPLTAGIDLNEGFLIGINASTLNPTLAWQLTGVLVSAFQPASGEQITIVNRSNTSLSLTLNSGNSTINGPGTVDVSALNIIVQGGASNLDAASVFMSSTTADGQNFRITGLQFEAIPEPSAALLGGLGLLALLRRQRAF